MEAKLRLESKLENLPGWQLCKPVDYGTDLELYQTVYDTWTRNWDATDPRYYHLEASETFLLRRWMEFDTLAHLFHYGPKGSGKNQALEIHQQTAPFPILVSGPSINSIYQVVDMVHPTLLMDECDRLGKVKEASDYVQAMLQILNVYKRGAVTLRGTQEGIPRLYDLFCPKLLAGTELLPGTLPDRTIRIDCERNVKQIKMDLDIPETLKGQLLKYSSRHAEYNGLTKDQLNLLIGDNRITQLYYPLFSVCPDPQGQKAILDLALEHLTERGQEETYGELAQILEEIVREVEAQLEPSATVATVLSDVGDRDPFYVDLETLVNDCRDFTPKTIKDPKKWLGHKLSKLQFHTERVGHSNQRLVKVPVRVLAKKVRRYAPSLLHNENNGRNGREQN
jgi:hypothetical protein